MLSPAWFCSAGASAGSVLVLLWTVDEASIALTSALGALVAIVVGSVVAGGIYLILAWLFRVPPVRQATAAVRSRVLGGA